MSSLTNDVPAPLTVVVLSAVALSKPLLLDLGESRNVSPLRSARRRSTSQSYVNAMLPTRSSKLWTDSVAATESAQNKLFRTTLGRRYVCC